jgi:hypothetical protein
MILSEQPGGSYRKEILQLWGWRPPLTTTAVGHGGPPRSGSPSRSAMWRLIPAWDPGQDRQRPLTEGNFGPQ